MVRGQNLGSWWLVSKPVTKPLYFDRASWTRLQAGVQTSAWTWHYEGLWKIAARLTTFTPMNEKLVYVYRDVRRSGGIVPSPIPSESRQHPLWLKMQTLKVLKCPCINHLRLKSTWKCHQYSLLVVFRHLNVIKNKTRCTVNILGNKVIWHFVCFNRDCNLKSIPNTLTPRQHVGSSS